MSSYRKAVPLALILAGMLAAPASAQVLDLATDDGADDLISYRIVPSALVDKAGMLFSIERNREERDFQASVIEQAMNFNLGVEVTPLENLNLRAEAFRMTVDEMPAANNVPGASAPPQLFIEDSRINEFNLDNPLIGSNVKSTGFDLGASYMWETSRFGQFTLSSQTTYVREFENNGSLLELASAEVSGIGERMISPELQTSLMLSWEFGNHTASAITNYFDSFKDLNELDIEEINDLVENMTTVDLEYGYSVSTNSGDRAIISFGIQNIFDEKAAQILNSSTRILDQNGRVAYGKIKYQF
ncbi:MAG: TonB-dependent receptor [Gammaproteobacteria bacterium]